VRPLYSTTLFSALWSNLIPAGNVFLGKDVVEMFAEVFVVVVAIVSLLVSFFDRRGNHRGIVTVYYALCLGVAGIGANVQDSRYFLVKYIMAMRDVGVCMSACDANAKGSHG
jgi:hypothetical protein